MIWKLTTLHAEFTNLLVVGIFVELHGTGEYQGQPGKDILETEPNNIFIIGTEVKGPVEVPLPLLVFYI